MLFIMLCQLSPDTCKCSNIHIKSAEYEIWVINEIKCYKFETELSLLWAIVLYNVIGKYPDNIILFKNMDYYFMSEP